MKPIKVLVTLTGFSAWIGSIFPVGDVVHNRIPSHIIQRFFFGNAFADFANHYSQLALPVHMVRRNKWDQNRGKVGVQGAGRLHENVRESLVALRCQTTLLSDMLGVVACEQ